MKKPPRIFLLSPAHCGGKRAELLFRANAGFDMPARLRAEPGVPIGEVFAFISGLYFRGKIAYAQAFARPPRRTPGALVITGGRGLMRLDERITIEDLSRFCDIPVDLSHTEYREPLVADLQRLNAKLPRACEVVLLGSVATPKYLELLLGAFGPRVYFPEAFIGMGDMQRGALMLRAAAAGEELAYVRADTAPRSRAAARKAL